MQHHRRITFAILFAFCGVLLGSIATTSAQAPPQPPKGQGVQLAVSAVDAVTGETLPGVKIELHRLRTMADPREWSYTATTDAKGSAVIPEVMAERYAIRATLAGRRPVSGAEQILALVPAAKPAPVVLRLFKSVAIEGVVEDGDRKPLAGTRVELLEERWTAGQRTLARIRTAELTGPAGAFSFEDVLPGAYYLRARPDPLVIAQQLRETSGAADPEARNVAFVNTLYPDAQFLETARALVLTTESGRQQVRIQVQKSRRYTVRGRVGNLSPAVSSPGLIFIRTVSFESRFPFILDEPYDEIVPTRIDRDGTFTCEPCLPPGQYWAGYTPGGQANRFGGMEFRVTDQDVQLDTELWDGYPLEGRVQFEDGTSAGSLTGTLRTFWSRRSVRNDAFSTTPEGTFNRQLYSDGIFRIEFPGTGLTVKKIEKDARTWTGPEFEVSRGGGPTVITVTREGAAINGSVRLHQNAQGSPRGIVTLTIDPANPLDVPLRKRLNAPGNFAFEHLEAGRYRLCAWVEEGTEVNRVLGNPVFDQRLASLCQSVEARAGATASVELTQLSALELR